MNGENVFYVYEHWRPDKGVCFYVGKGKGKRAWDLKRVRNRHHMAVTSKLTSMGLMVDVRIVVAGLSSKSALALEIDRIAMYGRDNLTNMTRGGDGLVDPSPEVRQRMSIAIKAAYSTPEARQKASDRNRGRVTSEETKEKLRLTSTGRKHTDDAKNRIREARKIAGIPFHVKKAQIAAVTGKERAPFKESTIVKMRLAAKIREEKKRLAREVA